MYTECFYQADFQRNWGLYLRNIVLYVLMKEAETHPLIVEAYDFRC